jgi:hypothetical protein
LLALAHLRIAGFERVEIVRHRRTYANHRLRRL